MCERCGDVGELGLTCPSCGSTILNRRIFNSRSDKLAFAIGSLVGYAAVVFVAFTSADGPPDLVELILLLIQGTIFAIPCGLLSLYLYNAEPRFPA